MKGLVLLGFICLSQFVKCQDTQIGSDIFEGDLIGRLDMEVTNNGNVFAAGIDLDDYLQIRYFDGVSWVNTSSEFLDSSVIAMRLIYNRESDSVFVGYIKSDGFYLRSFDGNWSSPSYFSCSPSTQWADGQLIGSIDVTTNSPMFLFKNLAPSLNTTLIIFDSFSSSFTEIAGPSIGCEIYESSLAFNPNDGYPYYSFFEGDKLKIESYNGLSWTTFSDEISNSTSYDHGRIRIFHLSNNNEFLVPYFYSTNSGVNTRGIVRIDELTSAKTVIQAESSSSNSYSIRDAVVDYYNNTFFIEYGDGYYIGWDTSNYLEFNLSGYYPSDFKFDQLGNLYWLSGGTNNTEHDVFMKEAYSLKVSDKYSVASLIYPNPATNQIQINSDELNSVSFYSIDGALVAEGYTVSKSQPLIIDFLPSGLYLVQLVDPNGKVTQQRVVIE